MDARTKFNRALNRKIRPGQSRRHFTLKLGRAIALVSEPCCSLKDGMAALEWLCRKKAWKAGSLALLRQPRKGYPDAAGMLKARLDFHLGTNVNLHSSMFWGLMNTDLFNRIDTFALLVVTIAKGRVESIGSDRWAAALGHNLAIARTPVLCDFCDRPAVIFAGEDYLCEGHRAEADQ